MALVGFIYGTDSAIHSYKEIKAGVWYFATDTNYLYLGQDNNALIQVHDSPSYLNSIIDSRLDEKIKDKTAISSARQQMISADKGTVMSKVTIEAMPYSEESNASGGTTVTIG